VVEFLSNPGKFQKLGGRISKGRGLGVGRWIAWSKKRGVDFGNKRRRSASGRCT
jgi:hypothetical protein